LACSWSITSNGSYLAEVLEALRHEAWGKARGDCLPPEPARPPAIAFKTPMRLAPSVTLWAWECAGATTTEASGGTGTAPSVANAPWCPGIPRRSPAAS
jgi:hypothetical protein